MRKGQNPSKDSLPAYHPRRLGVAVVSYIPTQAGYFERSLEVLQYEIASIRRSTNVPFDLYLFDNGSCDTVQAELQRLHAAGWIDFLFSSRHNLGKIGAINWILGAVPNELVCYADSDVLFRPGWFEHSLAILENFPMAGLVSAQPCLDDVLQGRGQAEHRFDEDPEYAVAECAIEPRWVEEYARGFGYPPERAEVFKKNLYKIVTQRRTGVQAVVGATHVQFLMPAQLGRQLVPLPARMSLSRKEDFNLNQAVDQKGYLHLSTPEPFYYHMGNTPDATVLEEIERMRLGEVFQAPPKLEDRGGTRPFLRLLRRISRSGPLRAIVYRLYRLLFELYS